MNWEIAMLFFEKQLKQNLYQSYWNRLLSAAAIFEIKCNLNSKNSTSEFNFK